MQQGITQDFIAHLKDKFSGFSIIVVTYHEDQFVFRTMSRKEYKYLLTLGYNHLDMQDAICNLTCLYPEQYDFNTCGYAGMSEYVSGVIKKASGFDNIKDVLSVYSEYKEMSNLEIQCMDLIKAFMPEYSYEEMEDWTWDKLVYMTVRAEKVAEYKGFDWHINDESDDYVRAMERINSDNKEFIKELEDNGVDPMLYFEDEMKNIHKKEVMDFPLISGSHWQEEEILDAIRKQKPRKNR